MFDSDGVYVGPVVVICGPTGSGKTGAAIKLALKLGEILGVREEDGNSAGVVYGGEIISADSRAIYKYMDIGTAKPDMKERAGVPHFGFDLVEPGERFTVADFKEYVLERIKEIRVRGHVPIVAGGTGLYVDALVYDYQFGKKVAESELAEGGVGSGFEQKSCSKKTEVDADFAEKYPDRVEMSREYLVYGISWESEELRRRLMLRAQKMYSEDLYKETEFLVSKYGWGSQAMKSNIYQFAWAYLNGEMDLDIAIEQFFYDDWHLAKRQMTWFKRNQNIKWYKLDEICSKILEDVIK